MDHKGQCRLVRPSGSYAGKQGLDYLQGVSAESVGAKGICMHLLTLPPGSRAKAHPHEAHETALFVLSGVAEMRYGDRLQHHMRVVAGDMVFIPAGEPHLPFNPGEEPVVAVIARTDPNEQESVTLLPQLEGLAPR